MGKIRDLASRLFLSGVLAAGSAGLANLNGCVYNPNCSNTGAQTPEDYNPEGFFPGIYTGSGWIDSNQNGRMDKSEVQNLGKSVFRNGERMLIFGMTSPPYGRTMKIVLYDEETGRAVEQVGEFISHPNMCGIKLEANVQIDSPKKGIAKLYINGQEVGSHHIELIP